MPFLFRFGLNIRLRWVSIISALLCALVLGGCSAVRLGYNNAPSLGYWWLDRYFDFDAAQNVRMRADLQALQDWHRKQELPLLDLQLKKVRTTAAQPVTTEQVCSLYADLQTRAEAVLDRAVPSIAALAPTLQEAQLEHISREFDKRNRTWREEWLDGTPAQRNERRVKQIVKRAESFYGPLTHAQLVLVQEQVRASDFDANLLQQEKLRRHQDALQTLRALGSNAATPLQGQQGQVQIRGLLTRSLHPPDAAMRQNWDRWTRQTCAAVAALHNSSSTAQRERVAQTLAGYEADIAALVDQR
jgi:hypothetical protein